MTSISNRAEKNTVDTELLADLLIESLQRGEAPLLTVISNSMAPLLERNDQVMLVPVDLETLKKGDIITVKSEEGFLTHRVVSLSNRKIQTKGDRNISLDQSYHPHQIIGRVQQIRSKRFSHTINLDEGWGKKIGKLIYRLSVIEFFFIDLLQTGHRKQRNSSKVISVTFSTVMRLIIKTL